MQNLYSEDDTRVKLIDAKLYASSWSEENIIRNYYFTDGRKLIGNKRAEKKICRLFAQISKQQSCHHRS